MKAIHLTGGNHEHQVSACTNLQADYRMNGSYDLLESIVAIGYWQAGIVVGLLQGYAYAAAEACHAVGLTGFEQQLRGLLPRAKVGQPAAAAVMCCSDSVCLVMNHNTATRVTQDGLLLHAGCPTSCISPHVQCNPCPRYSVDHNSFVPKLSFAVAVANMMQHVQVSTSSTSYDRQAAAQAGKAGGPTASGGRRRRFFPFRKGNRHS